MGLLRISLFGVVQIAHDDQPSEMRPTRIVQALLAYLLLQRRRTHSREVLAGLFWGDHSHEQARSCLNTALWRLRRVLEPEGIPKGTYLLATPMGEIGFNQESAYWLDVAIFEERVEEVLSRPIHAMETADSSALENALRLHAGELLEGFYDDWALRERERLRSLYLEGVAHLMHYFKHRGAYAESLTWGQELLNCDPLREEIHREMMRLHLENGQRALAVQQYETCREILGKELGILPMEETQALHAQILAGADSFPPQDTGSGQPSNLRQAMQHLRQAVQDFDKGREQLRQAIQLVEGKRR